MALTRTGQGPIRFQWRGATYAKEVDAAVAEAMNNLAEEVADWLYNNLHRYPPHVDHQLAERSYARVGVFGGKRGLHAGSDAPYTIYHEVGGGGYEPHPQLREAMDMFKFRVTPAIRSAMQNRGLGR